MREYLNAGAMLSDDEKHRYRLWRYLQKSGPLYCFIGINPSTADASIDDATVRKWTGFVDRWGGQGYLVVNLATLRSTDVKGLKDAPMNDLNSIQHLFGAMSAADIIVPCWGATKKAPVDLSYMIQVVDAHATTMGKPVKCFGRTKDGDPKHPLMLSYDTPLVDYFTPSISRLLNGRSIDWEIIKRVGTEPSEILEQIPFVQSDEPYVYKPLRKDK